MEQKGRTVPTRVIAICECCGKEFVATERPNKMLQKYCSGECNRESQVPIDIPEDEIQRRAGIIRRIRERGVTKITPDMLDW